MRKVTVRRAISLIMLFAVVLSATGIVFAERKDSDPVVIRYSSDVSSSEILAADVLEITVPELKEASGRVVDFIDNGGVLYISAPEISCEEAAGILGIRQQQRYTYPHALLTAYSVYKIDRTYAIEQHFVIFSDEPREDTGISEDFGNCITVNRYKQEHPDFSLEKFVNYEAAYNSYIDNRDFYNSGNNLLYSAGISGSSMFSDILYVYNSSGTCYGYLRGTIYVSEYGYGYVNHTSGYLYNLVANVKAYPYTGYYVSKYSCSVNANITGHTILDTATLPSGVSSTSTLSLSGNVSSSSYGAGTSFTTSWTYNPESQIITESSSNPRIINWSAQTVSPSSGKAYDVTPNASIFVSPGYSGQRGAFITMNCPAYTFLGYVNNENSLEIGGWF